MRCSHSLEIAPPLNIVIYLGSIIESVDSISWDGTDTPIYVIHYKKSEQLNF